MENRWDYDSLTPESGKRAAMLFQGLKSGDSAALTRRPTQVDLEDPIEGADILDRDELDEDEVGDESDAEDAEELDLDLDLDEDELEDDDEDDQGASGEGEDIVEREVDPTDEDLDDVEEQEE